MPPAWLHRSVYRPPARSSRHADAPPCQARRQSGCDRSRTPNRSVATWEALERHSVLAADIECRPCAYHECPIGHPCALGVTVGSVLKAAEAQLAAFARLTVATS